jgi:hypothetical protein
MKLSNIMILITLVGLVAGAVSAEISKNNIHWLWSMVAPLCMVGLWMELMRSHSDKLLLVTGLSDLLYNGTWFLGMMLMGIPTTWTQKLGILLLVAGVYLIG